MDALSLAVCPHDTMRHPEGWPRLVKYLSQHLSVPIDFLPSRDFADFYSRWPTVDLIYASSNDALTLIDGRGFQPLVRPTDTYDEALLVAGPDVLPPPLDAVGGAVVATVEGLLPTRLALRMLRARGITPGALANRDSWLSVVRAVWGGEVPFGIIYRDAYDALSPAGRAMVQVLTSTSERCAFHVFCAEPSVGSYAGCLSDALVAMAGDAAGNDILESVHLVGWRAVTTDELATMREIVA